MNLKVFQKYIYALWLLVLTQAAYADLDEDSTITSPPQKTKSPTPHAGDTDLGQSPRETEQTNKPKAPTPSQDEPFIESAPTPKPAKPKTPGAATKPGKKDSAKSQEPINFASQGAMAVKDPSIIELVKDVVLTQADMRLESDRVKAFMDQTTNQPVKIVATGNVKLFKEDADPTKKVRATGNEAVFYNATRKIILRGNPKLWRGDDLIRGKEITYELDTGWVKVDRVEGVLVPKASDTPKASE